MNSDIACNKLAPSHPEEPLQYLQPKLDRHLIEDVRKAREKLLPTVDDLLKTPPNDDEYRQGQHYLNFDQYEDAIWASEVIRKAHNLCFNKKLKTHHFLSRQRTHISINLNRQVYVDTSMLLEFIELNQMLEDVINKIGPEAKTSEHPNQPATTTSCVQTDHVSETSNSRITNGSGDESSNTNNIVVKLNENFFDDFLQTGRTELAPVYRPNKFIVMSTPNIRENHRGSRLSILSEETLSQENDGVIRDAKGAKNVVVKCMSDLDRVRVYLDTEKNDVALMTDVVVQTALVEQKTPDLSKNRGRRVSIQGSNSETEDTTWDLPGEDIQRVGSSTRQGLRVDDEQSKPSDDLERAIGNCSCAVCPADHDGYPICDDHTSKIVICIRGRNNEDDVQIIIRQCPDGPRTPTLDEQPPPTDTPKVKPKEEILPTIYETPYSSSKLKMKSKEEIPATTYETPYLSPEPVTSKSDEKTNISKSIVDQISQRTEDHQSYRENLILHNKDSKGSPICSSSSGSSDDLISAQKLLSSLDTQGIIAPNINVVYNVHDPGKSVVHSQSQQSWYGETNEDRAPVNCSKIKLNEPVNLCLVTEAGEELLVSLKIGPKPARVHPLQEIFSNTDEDEQEPMANGSTAARETKEDGFKDVSPKGSSEVERVYDYENTEVVYPKPTTRTFSRHTATTPQESMTKVRSQRDVFTQPPPPLVRRESIIKPRSQRDVYTEPSRQEKPRNQTDDYIEPLRNESTIRRRSQRDVYTEPRNQTDDYTEPLRKESTIRRRSQRDVYIEPSRQEIPRDQTDDYTEPLRKESTIRRRSQRDVYIEPSRQEIPRDQTDDYTEPLRKESTIRRRSQRDVYTEPSRLESRTTRRSLVGVSQKIRSRRPSDELYTLQDKSAQTSFECFPKPPDYMDESPIKEKSVTRHVSTTKYYDGEKLITETIEEVTVEKEETDRGSRTKSDSLINVYDLDQDDVRGSVTEGGRKVDSKPDLDQAQVRESFADAGRRVESYPDLAFAVPSQGSVLPIRSKSQVGRERSALIPTESLRMRSRSSNLGKGSRTSRSQVRSRSRDLQADVALRESAEKILTQSPSESLPIRSRSSKLQDLQADDAPRASTAKLLVPMRSGSLPIRSKSSELRSLSNIISKSQDLQPDDTAKVEEELTVKEITREVYSEPQKGKSVNIISREPSKISAIRASGQSLSDGQDLVLHISRSRDDGTQEDRIIPLSRTKICSSLEFDVTVVETKLRTQRIENDNPRIIVRLNDLGVDNLLRACRPAKCCRKAILGEKMKKCLPYSASIRSLPLNDSDVTIIKQSLEMNVQKVKNSTDLQSFDQDRSNLAYYILLENPNPNRKNHKNITQWTVHNHQIGYLTSICYNHNYYKQKMSYYINLVSDFKDTVRSNLVYNVMYFEVVNSKPSKTGTTNNCSTKNSSASENIKKHNCCNKMSAESENKKERAPKYVDISNKRKTCQRSKIPVLKRSEYGKIDNETYNEEEEIYIVSLQSLPSENHHVSSQDVQNSIFNPLQGLNTLEEQSVRRTNVISKRSMEEISCTDSFEQSFNVFCKAGATSKQSIALSTKNSNFATFKTKRKKPEYYLSRSRSEISIKNNNNASLRCNTVYTKKVTNRRPSNIFERRPPNAGDNQFKISQPKLNAHKMDVPEYSDVIVDYLAVLLYEMIMKKLQKNGTTVRQLLEKTKGVASDKQHVAVQTDNNTGVQKGAGSLLKCPSTASKQENIKNTQKCQNITQIDKFINGTKSYIKFDERHIYTPTDFDSKLSKLTQAFPTSILGFDVNKYCQFPEYNPLHMHKSFQINNAEYVKNTKVFPKTFKNDVSLLGAEPNSCDKFEKFVVVFKSDRSIKQKISEENVPLEINSGSGTSSCTNDSQKSISSSLMKLKETLQEYERSKNNENYGGSVKNASYNPVEYLIYQNNNYSKSVFENIKDFLCAQNAKASSDVCKKCGCYDMRNCPAKNDGTPGVCCCPSERKKPPQQKKKKKKRSKRNQTCLGSIKKSLSSIFKQSKGANATLCACSKLKQHKAVGGGPICIPPYAEIITCPNATQTMCECDQCEKFDQNGNCRCSHCVGIYDKSVDTSSTKADFSALCKCFKIMNGKAGDAKKDDSKKGNDSNVSATKSSSKNFSNILSPSKTKSERASTGSTQFYSARQNEDEREVTSQGSRSPTKSEPASNGSTQFYSARQNEDEREVTSQGSRSPTKSEPASNGSTQFYSARQNDDEREATYQASRSPSDSRSVSSRTSGLDRYGSEQYCVMLPPPTMFQDFKELSLLKSSGLEQQNYLTLSNLTLHSDKNNFGVEKRTAFEIGVLKDLVQLFMGHHGSPI